MVDVTADAALQQALAGLDGPARLVDTAGNVIGYFTPAPKVESTLYKAALAAFDPEEMKRRKESGGPYYTTREVLDHLGSLKSP
jgi:hypothetical protein